jgi:signal transduction histidine kinase
VRSLFIRIFLWFWAATVLLDAVLISTVYITEPEIQPPHFRSLTRSFLGLYAKNAVATYEQNGCEALNTFLARENPFPDSNLRRILTDGSGHGLCGAEAEEALTNAARHSASMGGPLLRRDRTLVTATHTTGPSGKSYVLLFELPRLRPPRFAVPASTWALRALALLLTAGIVCYGLAHHFASPVRRLRAVARRFAAGDLKARLGKDPLLKRRDELAELGKEFDQMAQRIELLVTRQEKMLESQRRLLGDISHELRSPLTRLALASGLLQRKVSDDAKPLLSRIDRESERLNVLIGQLLTLARLDAIPKPDALEPVDLNALLEEIVNDAAFEAGGRNVRIEFAASSKCVLQGARDLLRSAFENVLRNAVRYTAENTAVVVELECNSKLISVTVNDHGPGVPEKDLPHLFEPFYRVAEARDRQSGGTGLGLTIAERTVRLHGGSMEALNRPKAGLSVCMSFPVGVLAKPELDGVSSEVQVPKLMRPV